VIKIQGQSFKFSYNDYVVKILLATFVRWYFNVDRKKLGGDESYEYGRRKRGMIDGMEQQNVDTTQRQQYILQTAQTQQPAIRTVMVTPANDMNTNNRDQNCCRCCSIL